VSCGSCTMPIKGQFYRCMECSMYQPQSNVINSNTNLLNNDKKQSNKTQCCDFCTRCITNVGRVHAKHHFITSTTYVLDTEFTWNTFVNPRCQNSLVIDPNLADSLQHRELTTNDYDMLLELDKKTSHIPFSQTLLHSLKSHNINDIKDKIIICTLCNERILTSNTTTTTNNMNICVNNKYYELPCTHCAHEHCIVNDINMALEEGCWKIDDIICKNNHCTRKYIFGGISRKKRSQRQRNNVNTEPSNVSASVENSTTTAVSIESVLPLSFGIAGTSLGVGSASDRESSLRSVSGLPPIDVIDVLQSSTTRNPLPSSDSYVTKRNAAYSIAKSRRGLMVGATVTSKAKRQSNGQLQETNSNIVTGGELVCAATVIRSTNPNRHMQLDAANNSISYFNNTMASDATNMIHRNTSASIERNGTAASDIDSLMINSNTSVRRLQTKSATDGMTMNIPLLTGHELPSSTANRKALTLSSHKQRIDKSIGVLRVQKNIPNGNIDMCLHINQY
jgi:hypothetical protein